MCLSVGCLQSTAVCKHWIIQCKWIALYNYKSYEVIESVVEELLEIQEKPVQLNSP
jgi:hypothetical protein